MPATQQASPSPVPRGSPAPAPPLLKLPTELLLALLDFADIPEYLALRQCNHFLHEVSRERALWVSVLRRQQLYLPQPPALSSAADRAFQDIPTEALEAQAIQLHRVNDLWPRPRNPSSVLKLAKRHEGAELASLQGIQVFADRWLLVVLTEGVMEIYDLDKRVYVAQVALGSSGWISHVATFDEAEGTIVIAFTKILQPYFLDVWKWRVPKDDGEVSVFTRDMRTVLNAAQLVRAIEPTKHLIALSASTVELMRWTNDSNAAPPPDPPTTFPLPAYPGDPEDFWSGIAAIRFIGDFLLIAKTRTLELHHYAPSLDPNTSRHSFPPFKHYFDFRTFREVVFSSPTQVNSECHELVMLGSDVIQGLFQFRVKIYTPAPPDPSVQQGDMHGLNPHLDVELVALYPLSLLVAAPSTRASTNAAATSSNTGGVPPRGGSDTPTPLSSHNGHTSFFGGMTGWNKALNTVTRGFLSAFCIGPQGKRAVWVERARSSISREVQVWDRAAALDHAAELARRQGNGDFPDVADSGTRLSNQVTWADHFGENCLEMEKTVVYMASSFDLRDDITQCTFAETTGTIVLGTRSGKIKILPLPIGPCPSASWELVR